MWLVLQRMFAGMLRAVRARWRALTARWRAPSAGTPHASIG